PGTTYRCWWARPGRSSAVSRTPTATCSPTARWRTSWIGWASSRMSRPVSPVPCRVMTRRIVDWLDLRRDAAGTWAYDFAWRSAVSGVAEHCLDVPFIFDVLKDPHVTRVAGPAAPQALPDAVHGAYVRFARDG